MENVDLLTRINQHYNSFSKGQKLLANYIIDNYDRAAFITASKMGPHCRRKRIYGCPLCICFGL